MLPINPELQLASSFVRDTGCNIFLTGKAGTGKTSFLLQIKKDSGKRTVVTAPTGVAAINAGGVTLHSFFQIPFGPFLPEVKRTTRLRFNKTKIHLIKGIDLLIIDEISMVRADMLDAVDAVLRRYRDPDKAFGGVQVLLIGDLYQLAPVVKQDEWQLLKAYYKSPYFFASKVLAETELVCIELRHIYRQSDRHFINLLEEVRDNKVSQTTLDQLNARYENGLVSRDNEGYITLCTHNQHADQLNAKRLTRLPGKGHFFEARVDGDFPEQAYPAPLHLELKEGAQVMFLRNDISPEKRYFNGKIGVITRITANKVYVQGDEDPNEIEVEQATWENVSYVLDQESMEIKEEITGSFSQYPLKPAWAITIHKSQGLTFDRAIIDAQSSFAHGQVYVALSRCRSLEGMILASPLTRQAIKTDPAVQAFSRKAHYNPPTERQLNLARASYQQELMLDCFDFQRLHSYASRLLSLLQYNPGAVTEKKIEDPAGLKAVLTEEIYAVGNRFRSQLQGLFEAQKLPAGDPHILDRLTKASAYFTSRIRERIIDNHLTAGIETDNKETEKASKKLLTGLAEELAAKLAGLQHCAHGFASAEYLKTVTRAVLEVTEKRGKTARPTHKTVDLEHAGLYEELKDWRRQKADSEDLKPFQVMHLKAIVQIALKLPDSITALRQIKGIGEKIAARYGAEVIGMVRAYRKDKGLANTALPAALRFAAEKEEAPRPAKTESKTYSLQLFEKGLSVEEIAQRRDLKPGTIEVHLAHYVARGDLDIHRLVPRERCQQIREALRNRQPKGLREIKEALDETFSYGEIRLVLASVEQEGQQKKMDNAE
ncbi:MAG: helicase [Deltaproteobacteria bacterium]|nr:MAG: helicase [Deltaproteobacteria bacterium]